MIRRLQLLEPGERRFRRAAALGGRIREALLHDNKVIPGVLGVLALLVFAWFLAGALMGGPPSEEGQQASSQSSLSQTPEEDQGSGSPAVPEAENRDVDSFAAFKPKDPFRQLIPPAPKATKEGTGGSTRPTAGGASKTGSSQKAGTSSAGGKASPGGGAQKAGTNAGGKASPGGGGAGGSTSGGGPGAKGSTSGGAGGGTLGGGGGDSRGGGLFNSGGNLAP